VKNPCDLQGQNCSQEFSPKQRYLASFFFLFANMEGQFAFCLLLPPYIGYRNRLVSFIRCQAAPTTVSISSLSFHQVYLFLFILPFSLLFL
jgi:hypothetical protein